MIEIGIDPRIRELAPGLVLGCVEARVATEPAGAALWAEMEEAAARMAARPAEPAAEPPIAALRALYRALGKTGICSVERSTVPSRGTFHRPFLARNRGTRRARCTARPL